MIIIEVTDTVYNVDIDVFEDTETINIEVGDYSGVQSIVAGANITVDNTDPFNPVVSSSGGGDIEGGSANTIYLTSQFIDGGNS